MSRLDKDTDRKLIWQKCIFALSQELVSRGFPIYERGLEVDFVEDKEALQLLQDGILELPRKDIALHDLERIWSITGSHRDIAGTEIKNLLIAECRGDFSPFQHLGMREGNQWVYVSKAVNKNKPM
ncbi:MAG TPA: hypothetical protein VEP90_22775 [Methylomirabilota bacterium]|jgi:hypothetical protein|nr:hypothetical protein [Methylomirabilota bacterium]